MKITSLFSLRRTPREQPSTARRTISYAGSVSVSEETAMQVSAFYRGVIYISTQIAKLPWDVKDKQNNILEDDPVYFLLNVAPNDEMNSYSFKIAMIQNALIHGNGYAEIERDLIGRPVALWPLESSAVTLVREDGGRGRLAYRVTGYSKSIPGEDAYLYPRDIFHVKNFHTKDGLVGQGVVEYGKTTLGISVGGDRMASGLFANSGLPSGVLLTDKTMSDEAYSRLKDSWKEQYGGKKAGSVAILEEGVKFAPIDVDPQVLQFLESRKFGVLEICRFLGLPPTKLFDTSGATFSNVENANLEVATDTLDAWAVNLELEADVKLLSNRHSGKFTEMNLLSVFRADSKTRADYYSKMMQTGSITPNEIRREEGRAPYEKGDEFYIATNNYTPTSRMDEVIDAQISKGTQKEDSSDEDTEEDKELKIAALAVLKSQGK